MANKTITLNAEIIEQLENLAASQGQSVDDVLKDFLATQPATSTNNNWASTVAKGMEDADTNWLDEPNASESSRHNYRDAVQQDWQQSQSVDNNND